MEFLAFFAYIVLAVLILLIMITIHEFGHYISGKLLKFKINEFSIGFGPKLFSRKNKKTGEVFAVRAIPLGGFCAFEGEEGIEEEGAAKGENKEVFEELKPTQIAQPVPAVQSVSQGELKNFTDHPPWKRIIVLLSGGLFNLISAVLFSFIFILAVGIEKPHQTVDYIFTHEGVVGGTPLNDLKKGDRIIKVDGKELTYMYNLPDALAKTSDTAIFTVERDGQIVEITLKKHEKVVEQKDDKGYEYKESKGFGFTRSAERNQKFLTALKYSIPYMLKMSWAVLGALGKLITFQVPLSEITGPVGTITTIAEYSILDWRYILLLMPLLAANLGIFNLMPVPALDGSKIVFCIIEWIRKKPVSRNLESMIHGIGILVLLGFIVFVDIAGIFTRCGL